MASPIWAYLFGAFLIVHGLGHAAGFTVPALAPGGRLLAALWLVALVGFVAAGLAFFAVGVPREWWRALAVGSAVVSLLPAIAFGRHLPQAFFADLGILAAVLWWRWPSPITAP